MGRGQKTSALFLWVLHKNIEGKVKTIDLFFQVCYNKLLYNTNLLYYYINCKVNI